MFSKVKNIMDRDFCSAFIFITCIKMLFIPMYHSTDMEVHRNWKAITHSLSYKEWYFEDTSVWTLDYPPFFAWFECGLSYVAKVFDSNLLNIKNLSYDTPRTLFFMRLSVIISDLVYVFAIKRIYNIFKLTSKNTCDPWIRGEVVFAMLMLWNPGLLIVDHIHFQYNGILNGFLFLSIAALLQDKYLEGAFWYCVLLNFKHLYLYFAPAYFVYLLKNYCFSHRKAKGKFIEEYFCIKNFLKLGALVSTIFLVSFGPFIASGQLTQVLRRLFPVKRGLTHAYWAPNVWALYNFLDRILATVAKAIFGYQLHGVGSITKGLVQEYNHVILPSIGVKSTIFLTLLSIMPFVWLIWKNPKNSTIFIQAIVGCAFGSFLFGYHVHEKAILMITLPLTLLAIHQQVFVNIYVLISCVGYFALFPLLHESGETPIKIILLILYSIYSYISLKCLHQQQSNDEKPESFSPLDVFFIVGLVPLQCLNSFGWTVFNLDVKYPFLPLLVTSVFCALSVLYCWVKYCKVVFTNYLL